MPKYEYCLENDVRRDVIRRLDLELPDGKPETPWAFWSRMDKAGRLQEVLDTYDRIEGNWAEWTSVPRETKTKFLVRVEREGRRAEAERVLEEFLDSGLTQREAQEKLVERFQPLDGSQTKFWATPNPWESGRLFLRKADQERLLAEASDQEPEEAAQQEAENRIAWAKHRRDERLALTAARQRARELKAEAAETAEAEVPVA